MHSNASPDEARATAAVFAAHPHDLVIIIIIISVITPQEGVHQIVSPSGRLAGQAPHRDAPNELGQLHQQAGMVLRHAVVLQAGHELVVPGAGAELDAPGWRDVDRPLHMMVPAHMARLSPVLEATQLLSGKMAASVLTDADVP